jgi:hypothetical protein
VLGFVANLTRYVGESFKDGFAKGVVLCLKGLVGFPTFAYLFVKSEREF